MKKIFFTVLFVLTNIMASFGQGGYYSCNFEDVHENARWQFISPSTNKWCIGTATSYGGVNSLYVSPDSGSTITNDYLGCRSVAYRELFLNAGQTFISFDYKGSFPSDNPGGYHGYLKVFLVPSSQQFGVDNLPIPNSYTGLVLPSGSIEIATLTDYTQIWMNKSYTFNITSSQKYKLCFLWFRSENNGYTYQPPFIDNIVLPNPSGMAIQSEQVQLTINSSITLPSSSVHISGEGIYSYFDTAYVKVTLDHYHITGWNKSLLPYYISPSKDSLAITMDNDYVLVYNAAIDTHHVNVNSRGGNTPSVTNNGYVPYLGTCTITALNNDSYWNFYAWSNGETLNPYTFVVTSDTTFTAIYLAPGETAHILQLQCSNPLYGYAEIYGTNIFNDIYQEGNVVLTATANYGYHFVQWSDGVTTNPRTINLIQDTYLTAIFAPNQYALSVLTNDATMGTVAGGGSFTYLTQTTITAIPSSHCHFVQWADGNTSNPRLVTVTQDMSYTAIFAQDPQYSINVSTNDPSRGSADGGGLFFAGDYATLSAYPNEHYYFSSWSDGVNANPYYLTVIENATYTAIFEPINYTVNLTCNDDYMGSVCGGGSYPYGSTANIEAQPFDGFRFIEWSDGNTHASRTLLVEGNVSLQAHFGDAHTEGIDDVENMLGYIYVQNRHIIVKGIKNDRVQIFDITGRKHQNDELLPMGVYMVKIDNAVTKKVVVL